jgi:hypothetical protein
MDFVSIIFFAVVWYGSGLSEHLPADPFVQTKNTTAGAHIFGALPFTDCLSQSAV